MNKLPVALALSGLVVIAGCSSSSSGGGTPTSAPPSAATSPTAQPQATDAASKTAATADITAMYATFFNSATPHSTSVTLLENGSSLGPAVADAAKIAKKDKTKETAKVLSVKFTSPTTATVIYNLLGNGKPLLAKADGNAVLQDGQWKVAETTFCTLVGLGASTIGLKKVPGCK
jgi:hypothetical protein